MQHVAHNSESGIKIENEINNVPKVGNSSTPSSPRSPPCSPPCTPPDTPQDRLSESSHYLSDSSASGEDISEVDSFLIDSVTLPEDSDSTISTNLLSQVEDSNSSPVDPETQARLQSLLKAAGINKLTSGDGKQLADPEVLRRLTSSVSCALDEAAAALTRMRSDNRQASKRALIKACTQGNVSAVRKLLKQGVSVNETSEEGESLLSLACSAGYYELAQVLLAMHASVEDRGSKGDCTPLMEAASAGFVDIVRLLLAHGADVNAQSATGNTPLMYACAGGHVQTVQVLLDAGANVEDHNENGHTPLMEAASAGHVEVAKMLLKHGAGINTHSNEFKESALTLACYKGHLDMVNFLLQAGADQEHKTDEMHTALMEASMDGHVEVAKLLLDSGAQVNMPTDSFESPLTLAACGGHVDLAILLIERGANIEEVNDEGYTALMEAAREGHEDMVAILLQKGARINAQTEETQETALTLACCGGFMEVADYLIKHGADLELGASTPVMEAAQEGHLELTRFLLDKGANVQAQTQTGDTALTYACENGHTDVADLLLEYGANLEHESEGGRTPLMKACRAGHLCTVQFLVSKDADINRQTTNNDHTPLSLACAGGHLAIVQFLLDKGANMFHKLKDNSTMLIEAAKGGATNVVQLLLDYPERRNPNVKKIKPNTTAVLPSVSAAGASVPAITAVAATQTCAVPASEAVEIIKNNVSANLSNGTVPGSSGLSSCPVTSDNQNKISPNAVRQIANVLPKTAVRKLCRDPRLSELRSSDVFSCNDAKKNAAVATDEVAIDDDDQVKLSTFSILQNVKLKRQTPATQQQEPEQEQQGETETSQLTSMVPEQAQNQQQTNIQSVSRNVLNKMLHSKKANTEEQRAEQMTNDDESSVGDVIETIPQSSYSLCSGKCSTDPVFANNAPVNVSCATDTANLPPPPPLIPISEVLQSTAISDRPKAKPTKKEGKMLRKQLVHLQQPQPNSQPLQLSTMQQQTQQTQTQIQQQQASPTRRANQEEQIILQQQAAQALHLKKLAQINAQLQQQVIKNQQQIELQQQQQQQLLQQQSAQTGQQTPQLGGSGTIAAATKAPNLAEIFNHQELLAQIQQMDSSFAKSFPDFAEKTIEKEMRAMQQLISCDMIQESLQRCHFLISEDEVSLEDIANGTLNVEEKRLCDVHQNSVTSMPTLLDTTLKGVEKYSTERTTNTCSPLSVNPLSSNEDGLITIPNVTFDQQMFSMPACSTVQVTLDSLSEEASKNGAAAAAAAPPLLTPPKLQQQAQNQLLQMAAASFESKTKPQGLAGLLRKEIMTSIDDPNQLFQKKQKALQSHAHQQQLLQQQLQQQRQQLIEQKQIQQNHLQQLQKFQSQKQAIANSSESIALNSQARQELHRHLNEMKAIAQSAAAHQNQNTVAKCVTDSTACYSATSTQTTVATIKKKIPFDDANALSKLGAMGKKMRTTVNSRVPPNAASVAKDDGTNVARVPSTNVGYNQNYSIDVDSETESNHDTALTLACAGGHEELVELLLSRGADIEHRDKKGFTPLILAATAGHEKVVELLINHNADIEAQSERTKDTPLSLACSGGRYEVVDLLLNKGANKEHRNVSDYTPLSLAASGGYVNIIKLLLSHGAEINSRTGSKLGISPLMLAAMNGHTAAVKLLLDMGSDINAQIETNRNTALTLACFQGRHEVVALLLERKANVEHRAKTGLTPLMEAASGGYVEVGRVLLEKGADVNAPPVPSSRDTALTIASDKGHVKFVELLINKGAQVEVKNKKGNSPTWLAANGGHVTVVDLLHKVGADIDSQDNRKVSCLMAAFRKGHVKTVTWMVDRVNQFPSDQEMTRYISTINDKDLLDKCQACMNIIRVAKDEQAEKANEFATILLEELDLEKTREEIKKMAAARRKERKRNKKLQKMFEKRKQQQIENNEEHSDSRKNEDEDADDDYQPSSSKDKKDVKGTIRRNLVDNVNRRNNLDNEEGDSGIDANSLGSCSSNEVKMSSTERQKDKKNKKQQPTSGESAKAANTTSIPSKRESRSTEKTNDKENKKKKKKEEENALKDEKTSPSPKETKASKSSAKNKSSNDSTAKAAPNAAKSKDEKQPEDRKTKNKKETTTLIFESKHAIHDDDLETVTSDNKKKKQMSSYSDDNPSGISSSSSNVNSKTTSKQGNKKGGAGGEEEWKEVVRKCISPTYRVKKVSVPLTAISRVIGRGGCNINAIRSTTGAHIEIEKQSKGQGERIITIKGSIEATKQANTLIGALIDDPEVDITQILPKSSKPVTTSACWDKTNSVVKGKNTVAPSSTASAKMLSSTQHAVTVVSVAATLTKTSTTTPAVMIVSSASYTPSIRTALNMTRGGCKVSSAPVAPFDKKPNHVVITSSTVTGNSCGSVSAPSTKTTMSYTSAIMMSTGKTPSKATFVVPTSVIATTTIVSQTFAAKVSETAGVTSKEKEQQQQQQHVAAAIKPPIAPPPPTSNSIFNRPPPTASAPPTLPATPSKPPFTMHATSPGIVTQPLSSMPAQLTQQLSHPPPPLPTSIAVVSQSTKPDVQVGTIPSEEQSPVSAASEYSLFNDTFTKVTQQSMWGRDCEESNSQKNLNFASVVTASGSPGSNTGNSVSHATFVDTEPPVQVDASKAPGYRGNAMCSPNMQKSAPSIRSSSAQSPSSSLSYSNSTNSISDQISTAAVAAANTPIARPTSVPSSVDNSQSYTPRALFPEKVTGPMYQCDQVQPKVSSAATSGVADDLSMSLMRMKVVSRLNPRAPDFRVPVKQSPVSLATSQLPPTHQPPPIFSQQSAASSYLNSQGQQLPATIMTNANMMSFPMNTKFAQPTTQTTDSQSQWSLMNAAAVAAAAAAVQQQQQQSTYSQNDLINFVTPTTLTNLIHAQGNDMLAGMENGGTLAGNAMSMSANASASMMAAAVGMRGSGEERKAPPKPIGTERAWRTERDRTLPLEQDPNSWMMDQKQSWNQQMFRNNGCTSKVAAVQNASAAPATASYSCLPQVPDDVRTPMLDGVYQNDHFNGIMQNTVLQSTLPPLLPPMNIGQVGSGPILQSFNPDIAYADTFKVESGWDPNRLCVSDLTLSAEKSHHQQQPSQPPSWALSWNH